MIILGHFLIYITKLGSKTNYFQAKNGILTLTVVKMSKTLNSYLNFKFLNKKIVLNKYDDKIHGV